jgi:hypothetical protein
MKLFLFIFSFYILYLITLPCVDEHLSCMAHQTDIAQSPSDHQHPGADHCSPFCTCDCCVVPFVHADQAIHMDSFAIPQEFISALPLTYGHSLFANIWQPPKLS